MARARDRCRRRIKLTPLIFIGYLVLTGRLLAAATATVAFAATIGVGMRFSAIGLGAWQPGRSPAHCVSCSATTRCRR
ncbi:hypothetical protein [Micromonospora sp. LOL_021]|uniref:hypothetical protein n=1 Tax=Micromonospora sp. LOL_021 TaxID=3345417 RepID=UPI003A875AAE